MRKWKTVSHIVLVAILLLPVMNLFQKADAHDQDYLGGQYTSSAPCNQSNLKLRVHESAISATLTSSIYLHGSDWNNKHCSTNCTHIRVSVSVVPDSIPPMTGYYDVYGENLNTANQNVLGKTIAYDSSNHIVNATSNWHHIVIKMNTVSSVFSNSYCSKTTAAQKTFLHEIGHALKLDHPAIGTNTIGHYVNGHPEAIMNEGHPNGADVSTTIKSHDISNLRAKWGY